MLRTCASAGNGMMDLYMSLTAQLTSSLLGADGAVFAAARRAMPMELNQDEVNLL